MTSALDFAPVLDLLRNVAIFGATGLLAWMARTLVQVRDEQRDMKHLVIGVDGTNGLRSKVKALEDEVEVIRERNLVIDAVAKVEEENYQGEERRQGQRRLRDLIREEMQAFNPRSPLHD